MSDGVVAPADGVAGATRGDRAASADELSAVRALLPDLRLDRAVDLGGSDRSRVTRVRARHADGAESSLIVKLFADAGEGWARECAALEVLRGTASAPTLVADGADPPIAVLTDLGEAPSLADALLGDDADEAERRLLQWADAVAALHAASRDLRPAFRVALDRRAGDFPLHETRLSNDIEDAVRVLDRACASLGVRVPADALDELHELVHRLGTDGPCALTSADLCPDNNVLLGDHLVLIDFEQAQWRHLAWDVAYLSVPFPTCSCAWRLPEHVTQHAIARYRQMVTPALPAVGEDAFLADVDAAVGGIAMMSVAWFLEHALTMDGTLFPDERVPNRRAVVLDRLAVTARCTQLPALAELATRLRAPLRERWDVLPLALAPAFR